MHAKTTAFRLFGLGCKVSASMPLLVVTAICKINNTFTILAYTYIRTYVFHYKMYNVSRRKLIAQPHRASKAKLMIF